MKARGVLLATMLLPAYGCYAYADTSLDAVPPGAEIRVEVSRDAAEKLRAALAADQRSIEGKVRDHVGDGLLLDVVTATRQSGFRYEPLRQTIRLEAADATSVQLKSLDRGRSLAALALAGAGLGAIAWKALGGRTGGKDNPQDPNQPSDARVLWLSFGWPSR